MPSASASGRSASPGQHYGAHKHQRLAACEAVRYGVAECGPNGFAPSPRCTPARRTRAGRPPPTSTRPSSAPTRRRRRQLPPARTSPATANPPLRTIAPAGPSTSAHRISQPPCTTTPSRSATVRRHRATPCATRTPYCPPTAEPPDPPARAGLPVGADQRDQVVDPRRVVGQFRPGVVRVRQPVVVRVALRLHALRLGHRRVVAAVVHQPDDPVVPARVHEPPRRRHRPYLIRLVERQRVLRLPSTPGGPPAAAARGSPWTPSTATPGPEYVLRGRQERVVPPERQQPALVRHAVLARSAATIPEHSRRVCPGVSGVGVEQRAHPVRRRSGHPVRQRTALVDRRAVGADQVHGVLQEPVQPLAIDASADPRRAPGVRRHPRPQARVEVHRPADVVVEVLPVAVGVPAVADVPVLDPVQARRRCRPASTALRPTRGTARRRPGTAASCCRASSSRRTRRATRRLLLRPRRRACPRSTPAISCSADRDRRRLHHLLRTRRQPRPRLRVVRIRAVRDARARTARPAASHPSPWHAGDPERGQHERPREPFQPVGRRTRPTRPPRAAATSEAPRASN